MNLENKISFSRPTKIRLKHPLKHPLKHLASEVLSLTPKVSPMQGVLRRWLEKGVMVVIRNSKLKLNFFLMY